MFPAFGILEETSGGVLLRGEADDLGWLARELARLPFSFEIVRPLALRDAVRAVAERLLKTTEVKRPRANGRKPGGAIHPS